MENETIILSSDEEENSALKIVNIESLKTKVELKLTTQSVLKRPTTPEKTSGNKDTSMTNSKNTSATIKKAVTRNAVIQKKNDLHFKEELEVSIIKEKHTQVENESLKTIDVEIPGFLNISNLLQPISPINGEIIKNNEIDVNKLRSQIQVKIGNDDLKTNKTDVKIEATKKSINSKTPKKPRIKISSKEIIDARNLEQFHSERRETNPQITSTDTEKPKSLESVSTKTTANRTTTPTTVKNRIKLTTIPRLQNIPPVKIVNSTISKDSKTSDSSAENSVKSLENPSSVIVTPVLPVQKRAVAKCNENDLQPVKKRIKVTKIAPRVENVGTVAEKSKETDEEVVVEAAKTSVSCVEPKPKTDETENQVLYKKFVDKFCEMEVNRSDREKGLSKLEKHLSRVHPEYKTSKEYKSLLEKCLNLIETDKHNLYFCLKELIDQFRENYAVLSKEGVDDEAGTSGTSKQPVFEIPSDMISEKLKKLSKVLKKLQKKIKVLEETEVDLKDEEESSYFLLQRYRDRFCQVHKKMCELSGQSNTAGSVYNTKISFNRTKFTAINKCIERYINKTKQFPDYQDILKLIESENTAKTLNLTPDQIRSTAADAFQEIGKQLQRRRRYDLWDTFSIYLDDKTDPAEEDPELARQLDQHLEVFRKREQELFDTYAERERTLRMKPEPVAEDEADQSPVDSDDDEKELEEYEQSLEQREVVSSASGNEQDDKVESGGEGSPVPDSKQNQTNQPVVVEADEASNDSVIQEIQIVKETPKKITEIDEMRSADSPGTTPKIPNMSKENTVLFNKISKICDKFSNVSKDVCEVIDLDDEPNIVPSKPPTYVVNYFNIRYNDGNLNNFCKNVFNKKVKNKRENKENNLVRKKKFKSIGTPIFCDITNINNYKSVFNKVTKCCNDDSNSGNSNNSSKEEKKSEENNRASSDNGSCNSNSDERSSGGGDEDGDKSKSNIKTENDTKKDEDDEEEEDETDEEDDDLCKLKEELSDLNKSAGGKGGEEFEKNTDEEDNKGGGEECKKAVDVNIVKVKEENLDVQDPVVQIERPELLMDSDVSLDMVKKEVVAEEELSNAEDKSEESSEQVDSGNVKQEPCEAEFDNVAISDSSILAAKIEPEEVNLKVENLNFVENEDGSLTKVTETKTVDEEEMGVDEVVTEEMCVDKVVKEEMCVDKVVKEEMCVDKIVTEESTDKDVQDATAAIVDTVEASLEPVVPQVTEDANDVEMKKQASPVTEEASGPSQVSLDLTCESDPEDNGIEETFVKINSQKRKADDDGESSGSDIEFIEEKEKIQKIERKKEVTTEETIHRLLEYSPKDLQITLPKSSKYFKSPSAASLKALDTLRKLKNISTTRVPASQVKKLSQKFEKKDENEIVVLKETKSTTRKPPPPPQPQVSSLPVISSVSGCTKNVYNKTFPIISSVRTMTNSAQRTILPNTSNNNRSCPARKKRVEFVVLE